MNRQSAIAKRHKVAGEAARLLYVHLAELLATGATLINTKLLNLGDIAAARSQHRPPACLEAHNKAHRADNWGKPAPACCVRLQGLCIQTRSARPGR